MEHKDHLLNLLESLKEVEIDRRKAESMLELSENYLDQAVTRGGNKKLIKRLEDLLQKARSEFTVSQRISSHLSKIDERLLKMESQVQILGQYIAETKHAVTGESTAKIALEMEKTTKDFLEHRMAELRKK